MAGEFKKLAVLCEEFTVPSAAQQLVDRFLIGYPRDNEFHWIFDLEVKIHLLGNPGNADLERRVSDLGVRKAESPQLLAKDADAILVVLRGRGSVANDGAVRELLEHAMPGARVFVHGALGTSLAEAKKLKALAEKRNIALVSGSALNVTWRLPEIDIPKNSKLKEALILVNGEVLAGEIDALESILPIIERRSGGETGVRRLRYLRDAEVWRAGDKKEWSWPLLAAAISRSDSPQGDPVKDGRTQDLVGLGLVPKLAKSPRAWSLEHHDGLRTTLMVLNGVVGDYNFAVAGQNGETWSAQVYRPPLPAQHEYSQLAAVLENFFRTGQAPWSVDRGLLIAGLMGKFSQASSQTGRWVHLERT